MASEVSEGAPVFSEMVVETVERPLPETQKEDIPPAMGAAGWTAYVLSLMRDEEKDPKGNPRVAGLRRVAQELLGDIVSSQSHVVAAPSLKNQTRATVEHTIEINWDRDGLAPHIRVFTGVADAGPDNMRAEFCPYPTAIASTRAKGRALRDALAIDIVAAEEIEDVPTPDALPAQVGKISREEITFLERLAQRNNINLMAFINHGQGKWEQIEDVPGDVAKKMTELMNEYQRDQTKIPASIKGYKSAEADQQ